jgi:o-succinylbenzoate synthase
MSTIRASVQPYRKPLRARLQTSQGAIGEREGCVFVLTDRDGRIARGEAAPAYWLGAEPVRRVVEVLEEVAAAVSTESLSIADLEETFVLPSVRPVANPRLSSIRSRLAQLPSARAAIDAACLESSALAAGRSVAEMLGGDAHVRIAVSAIVTAQDAGGISAAIANRAAQGFRTVKLKVGDIDPGGEVERLCGALRACDRFGLRLRIDANRAWTADQAKKILDAVAAAGAGSVEFVEEPLRVSDLSASVELRRATGVRLALDESLVDVDAVGRLAESGAMDVAVTKLARFGGPRASLEAAASAAKFGVPTAFTDSIETEVGVGAVAHTAAAAGASDKHSRFALGLGGPVLFCCDDGFQQQHFTVSVAPVGPGFHMEPEWGPGER